MANMTSEFLGKANGLTQDLKNKAVSVENQFENLTFKTGEAAGTIASNLVSAAGRNVKKSREYVIENPMAGIAMAAAAGLVTGSIITMLMRKK